MSHRTRKQKVIKLRVEVHIGHACRNCGERYVNPFKHICRTKTTSGKPRKARKPSKKKSWR